jgi:pentatricopeptide repeat protein
MKTFAQLVDNNVELSDYIVKDLAQQYTTPSTRQHLYTIWNYILHTNAQLDISSYNALILACAKTRTLLGEKIYYYMLESSLKSNLKVENNLMLMYINCGKFETARRIFDQLEPDAISYNILLNGSISHGMDFASSLFRTMPQQLKSAHTYSTLLRGCAKWRNVTFAVELYDSMPKELLQEPRVANECITMFAKLMDIERAEQVFTQLENKTFVSWTSMLGAYRTCANGEKAVKLFYEMIANDYKPNNYAYGNVLTACSRAHMPEQAMKIYLEMKKYHYKPTIENNNIMVDVLARCENVDKAIEFAKTLEKTDVVTWTTILSACVKQNKIEQGIVAGEMAIEMDPLDPSAYTLYAGLLRAAGRYEEAQAIRDKITALGLSTKPGTSMIEYQGEQIMFYSRSENPFSEEIEQGSEEFLRKLEQHGYKPDVSIIHTRVPENEESKKVKLFQHSERSALIFLLGRTKDEKTPIKIFSTLQICGDCHTVFALASKVYDREIQITAREQAHVFKNGKCSCNNKW